MHIEEMALMTCFMDGQGLKISDDARRLPVDRTEERKA